MRKTYYTGPRDRALSAVALLFNNLSDNLCGHSQDGIDSQKYQVLKSDKQLIHRIICQ